MAHWSIYHLCVNSLNVVPASLIASFKYELLQLFQRQLNCIQINCIQRTVAKVNAEISS